MSGHSKWSQIKHKKGINDAKRGKIFSKLSNQITVAARQKGKDLSTNPTLKMLVEKGRAFNMPAENIERAIKKGTGELEGVKIEELTIEAYGPGGVALIIEAISDSKNRTISEIKFILTNHDGKMAESGSVNWMFEKKGALIINSATTGLNKESLELTVIDCGADDLKWQADDMLEIFTKVEDLDKVRKALEAKNIKPESSSLDWVPKTKIAVEDPKAKEHIDKLFEVLEENDDVNEIYSNIKSD